MMVLKRIFWGLNCYSRHHSRYGSEYHWKYDSQYCNFQLNWIFVWPDSIHHSPRFTNCFLCTSSKRRCHNFRSGGVAMSIDVLLNSWLEQNPRDGSGSSKGWSHGCRKQHDDPIGGSPGVLKRKGCHILGNVNINMMWIYNDTHNMYNDMN